MSCQCAHCGSVLDDTMFGAELLSVKGISPIATFVLRRLIKAQGAPVHIESLIHAAYSHRRDGGPLNAVQYVKRMVYILKYNTVPKYGYKIENIRGFGYRLVRHNVIELRPRQAA